MTDRDYDSPEREAVRKATAKMIDEQAVALRRGDTSMSESVTVTDAVVVDLDNLDDTNPNGRMSNEELLDALKLDANEREQRREEVDATRHKTVVDKLTSLEGRVDVTEKDIAQIKRNAFPQAPLWFLVIALWTFGTIESVLRVYSIEHAPYVHAIPR